MDIISLKKYLLEDNRIETLLLDIGCHKVKYHSDKEYYSCANYNGDNPNAVNVKKNEYLNVRNWTRGKDFNEHSDIFTLVQYNKGISFAEAVRYIHSLFELEFSFKKKSKEKLKPNPLSVFTKYITKQVVNVTEIEVLDEKLLDNYYPYIHISWFREGIMPWTAKKFGIAYSYRQQRIIIPMRYWLTGELLGVNSRTTVENYKEFGIKKFFITPTYPKGLNLYGLYENYNEIIQKGYVVVYEAEKSVLKRHSLNDGTGVALSGHSITEEQIRILIGLNVDIVISLDNDRDIEESRFLCEKFYGVRSVYYTKNIDEKLGAKDSIADLSNKGFLYLFNNKVKYDYKEHCKYLENMNKRF